ncbi:hypothetical protein ACFL0Z_03125 [Patescibacteria group bacterium]
MAKLSTKVSEILVTNPNTSAGFADTFVFEPAEDKELTYGHLLILISFSDKTKKTPEISEAIASIMQNTYYSSSDRGTEEQFEWAVKRVNEILGDLASAGEVSWVGQLHSVIAAFTDDQIFVTSVGDAKAYLIRRHQLSQLNKDTSTVPLKPNPLKTYQNIISGQVSLGDKFVLLSPMVLDYIEKAKVKEIVDRFTPDIAARHLHSRLISFKDKESLATLVAEVTPESVQPATPPVPTTRSSKKATIKGKKTEAPGRRPATTPLKSPPGALQRTSSLFKSLAGKTADTTKYKLLPLFKGKKPTSSVPKTKPASKIDKKSSEPISSRKSYTYTDTRPKPWWRKLGTMLKNIGTEIASRFMRWFKKLPRTSKILFIVVVVLLTAFLVSLAAVRGNQESQERQAFYETRTSEAITKEEEAEAAIIYGNDTKARQLLEEAKAIAEDVQTSKYPNQEAAAVLSQIDEDYLRLDRISRINDPEIVTDFAFLGEGVNTYGLTISDPYLVSYNPSPGSLYLFDTETDEIKAVEIEPSGDIISITANESEAALVTTEPALVRYDFSGDIAQTASSDLESDQNLKAISLFGNRLYTLDPTKNQIQKMSATLGGFSKGSDWLSEDVDLSQGVDLTIDGSIYVLTSDGNVLKLLRGYKNEFEIKNLSTSLSDPSHIYTNDETNNIYILDPGNDRLVVLDKEGNLQSQYLSDAFTDLRGMAIVESEKKAYLLNGTKVLGIKLAD